MQKFVKKILNIFIKISKISNNDGNINFITADKINNFAS